MENNNLKIKTLVGIVTFNSDPDRLYENVDAVYPQADKLLIFDNGSNNISEIKESLTKFKGIKFIESPDNKGIAKALSEIMQFAIDNNFDWVLTLDDDSVCENNLINEYKKFINIPNVAAMTCKMEDRNYFMNEKPIEGDYKFVRQAITSGCFMSVKAYKASDGYCEELFIDRVDDDICYNLLVHGYKIIKINFTGLLHEMGAGEIHNFLWHKARAVNYSPARRYYIFRNETIVRNKYPSLYKREWLESGRPMWLNFTLSTLKILLYENNKFKKISSSWKGWADGRKYVREKLYKN